MLLAPGAGPPHHHPRGPHEAGGGQQGRGDDGGRQGGGGHRDQPRGLPGRAGGVEQGQGDRPVPDPELLRVHHQLIHLSDVHCPVIHDVLSLLTVMLDNKRGNILDIVMLAIGK